MRMLAVDAIEPAQTKWASEIGFVPIQDGRSGVYVDYLILNPVTIRDTNSIPCIDECEDSLPTIRYFRL